MPDFVEVKSLDHYNKLIERKDHLFIIDLHDLIKPSSFFEDYSNVTILKNVTVTNLSDDINEITKLVFIINKIPVDKLTSNDAIVLDDGVVLGVFFTSSLYKDIIDKWLKLIKKNI